MGTRSLTKIFDEEQELVCIYRQYDGSPEGMGLDLINFIASGELVSGYTKDTGQFNTIRCFAAQLIGHLKNGKTGNIYIYPTGSKNCGEEFEYCIRVINNKIKLEAFEIDGYSATPIDLTKIEGL